VDTPNSSVISSEILVGCPWNQRIAHTQMHVHVSNVNRQGLCSTTTVERQ
jgi:hypothetical protein